MNLSKMTKVQDPIAKQLLFSQQTTIENLLKRVEELEQRQQPIQAIGIKLGTNSPSIENMFPKCTFVGGGT